MTGRISDKNESADPEVQAKTSAQELISVIRPSPRAGMIAERIGLFGWQQKLKSVDDADDKRSCIEM